MPSLEHDNSFTCKYCHKSFKREQSFIAHECKQIKRLNELKTPTGQAAYAFYQRWLLSMKRTCPTPHTFLDSKFFRTFINFATFVKRVNLPRPNTFIWLMSVKSFPPTMWTMDSVYEIYLEFLDHKIPPIEHIKTTIETLLAIAEAANADVSDVFDVLLPIEVIQLVRNRSITPWILLNSRKFKLFYHNRLTAEQRIILENLISPEFWVQRFNANPEIVAVSKQVVQELEI